jgi:hypothetical protein
MCTGCMLQSNCKAAPQPLNNSASLPLNT